MIRVVKPDAPAKLLEGVPLTAADCLLYDDAAAAYDAGTANFEISSAIYGHAQVKDVLRAAQHSKCCFCEGMFDANAAADVEHFRPKKTRSKAGAKPSSILVITGWDMLGATSIIAVRSATAATRRTFSRLATRRPARVTITAMSLPKRH